MLLDLTAAQEIVDDCISCGLCLESCPTYVLWGEEADSPRGRIIQIGEALADGGTVPVATVPHIDACLGCSACVQACPSGVAYDRLLIEARTLVERGTERSGADRGLRLAALETLPYPGRMRKLLPAISTAKALGNRRRLPDRVTRLAGMLPDPPSREQRGAPLPSFTPAVGTSRGRVGLLLGCVQRVFHADIHRATIGVLTREGYDVVAPALPDCCGAFELGAGEPEHALARAEATIAAFAEHGELDAIIANAGGCGAAMKDYGAMLGTEAAWAFAGRVRDVMEFLAEIEPQAPRGELPLRVMYHDACQLAHGQGVVSGPRTLLSAIPGLTLLEPAAEAGICCGAPDLYPLLQPGTSRQLGARKASHLGAGSPDVIVAGSPSCLTQIRRHLRAEATTPEILHPVELLWRSVGAARP